MSTAAVERRLTRSSRVVNLPPVVRARLRAYRLEHFVKYLVIGATAMAIDLGLFLVLHNLAAFPPVLAHSISVPVAVVFSFACNARHNFRTTDHIALRFASFTAVAFLGYLLGVVVIVVARDSFGVSANLAKVVSLPMVFVLQYLLNSKISFRKAEAAR